jgi:hypothetical protein
MQIRLTCTTAAPSRNFSIKNSRLTKTHTHTQKASLHLQSQLAVFPA